MCVAVERVERIRGGVGWSGKEKSMLQWEEKTVL